MKMQQNYTINICSKKLINLNQLLDPSSQYHYSVAGASTCWPMP